MVDDANPQQPRMRTADLSGATGGFGRPMVNRLARTTAVTLGRSGGKTEHGGQDAAAVIEGAEAGVAAVSVRTLAFGSGEHAPGGVRVLWPAGVCATKASVPGR